MMDEFLHIDKTFEKSVLIDGQINDREFDGCTFRNCDFSGSTFSGCTFVDCEFLDCNLSMAKFPKTGLKTAVFRNCKLLGIRFDACDDFLFNVSFFDSTLDYSWFIGKKMPKTLFSNASLKGVNFSNADLSSSDFAGSDLADAVFDETKLDGADCSSARNYRIDPQFNSLKKAKFSLDGLHGLLDKYQIDIR